MRSFEAVLKTANLLGLSNTQLATVMGLDLMSMNQIEFSAVLEPASPQGEYGLLLIRLYQSLSTLTGGDSEWIDYFMNAFNTATEPYRVCRRVNILRDYPDDKIKIYP